MGNGTLLDVGLCHTRLMTNDESQMIDINAKPVYQASLRLKSGPTVRVTTMGHKVLMDIRDDDGRAVAGQMTDHEAGQVASMCRAAEGMCL